MSVGLFQDDFGHTVFKDLRVLSPHYVPKELPYRNKEIKHVSRILSPALQGIKPNNIFLYGKTGTGKTSVVKLVLRELVSTVEKQGNGVKSVTVYMNCRLGYNSKYQVLIKILEDNQFRQEEFRDRPLDGVRTGKLEGRSPTELYKRLKGVVESNAINLIIVLDEVDMVREVDELIYLLTRVNDEIETIDDDSGGRRGSVSLIGISNKHSFRNNLDTRTKSTLCEEELVFKPYNAKELATILKHRVKEGFKSSSIAESSIKLIAAFAAQTNGDARYALKLLHKAGDIAESADRKRVRLDDVKDAKAKVEEDVIIELISTLPEHQQIVLYSIAKKSMSGSSYKRFSDLPEGVLFSGEVYESYEKICSLLNRKKRTMRWFGEYLKELEMLGLITLDVSGRGVRGNTTLIRLGGDAKEVKKIVSESLGLD